MRFNPGTTQLRPVADRVPSTKVIQRRSVVRTTADVWRNPSYDLEVNSNFEM